MPGTFINESPNREKSRLLTLTDTASTFEREALVRPFGFKGGYLTELWQVISRLRSSSGKEGVGLATQSVLYGDAALFSSLSETEGNTLMYGVTMEAMKIAKTMSFHNPVELLELVLRQFAESASVITGRDNLNANFIYNALVSVDNAAWLLYAAENGYLSFDEMIPSEYKNAVSHHNDKIAIMYQVPYGMPMTELEAAVDQGYFVIKIKTGAPGSQEDMLQADMDRLSLIHTTLQHKRTSNTETGRLWYSMDANARYEKKETLLRYLDHAEKIGAMEQVLLYEEPLIESNREEVGDIGIRIAADESAKDEQSALQRLELGYGAVVLKGIAKTLSASLKIARLAFQKNVPCFCSDLTVNPVLVDWHKNLAARLAPFPGIGMGLMETNGDSNYQHWEKMCRYHTEAAATWAMRTNGVFELNDDFYQKSGGIFDVPRHYTSKFTNAV